ncbi:MAG: formate hydrogenlyase subunit 6/NADH:ubiquinone oxidoreductase subunit I [Haloarculaceae archaeon]|jgi:formate hydrogenlyase subunit 6/NADH:ubiquinone oxidoreductase subunit I
MDTGIDTEASGTETVEITLDGETKRVERNRPLIEVARDHSSYVPGWCHHPGTRPTSELDARDTVFRTQDAPMPKHARGVSALGDEAGTEGVTIEGEVGSYDGCGICKIEVNGEVVKACETRASQGQDVRTATEEVRERQQAAMGEIFKHHPHACLDCPQKQGCDRITCSMNVPEEHRCCDLIGNCELEKSAAAIDIDWSEIPAYEPQERSGQTTTVFDINWELCIGCNRCVGVCEDHVGAGVWDFTVEAETPQGEHTTATVGLKAETLAKAGCKFCTTCVDACPTGTLMDNGAAENDRLPLEYRESLPDVQFPDSKLPLSHSVVETDVPADGGVYLLYNEDDDVVEINGVPDLSAALLDEVDDSSAVEFELELDESFTQRETELIEEYVNEHGHMPGDGGAMDDALF